MRIQILKFGGTSLKTSALRLEAVARVREVLMKGSLPVVIVSAFGRKGDPYATDSLLNLALSIDAEVPSREVAMLTSCGEIISAVVLASVLRHRGLAAVALTGSQAGIKTVGDYTGASIQSVDESGVISLLRQGYIPIITGFQGAMTNGEITVLSRGGSDISSTALGYALQAKCVDIYTDVPGVMTADPRLVKHARLIDLLTFDEALLLAQHGAKVIHPDAVEWAKKGAIPVYIRSLHIPGQGTLIAPDTEGVHANSPIGIACTQEEGSNSAVVSVIGAAFQATSTLPQVIRTTLNTTGVPCMALDVRPGVVMATVPEKQMERAACALHDHFLLGHRKALDPACQLAV